MFVNNNFFRYTNSVRKFLTDFYFRVPYSGPLVRVLGPFVAGLRSGMTYVGASDIDEMKRPHSRKFTRVSSAAWEESKPHDIEIV